ncbi:hypothetical protein F5887DRAFT_935312, partial [Amanita rubescens]
HNQTSTLRNVFQLQTSSGTSTAAGTGPWNGNGSSSRGNSHGPGPGGQKQNTGSRFYAGFTGPVRAVTQANAVTSQDGTFVQNDDNQEEQAVPPRHRIRSSKTLGVLKTVQIHARSRHAFAHAHDTAKTPRTHSRRLITRRNSTSSQTSDSTSIRLNSTYAVSDESSVDPASIPIDLSDADPSSEQPPQHLPEQNADDLPPPFYREESSAYAALKAARDSNDPAIVGDTTRKSTIREFNMALEAILQTRTAGEPLTLMLRTYHDLLRCQITPTVQTYDSLIPQMFIRGIQARLNRQATLTGEFDLTALNQEENFSSAMGLDGSKLSANTYISLLPTRLFSLLNNLPNVQPPSSAYKYTIQAYANAGNIQDAEQVDNPGHRRNMIEGYFQVGMPEKAVGLVEEMLSKSADDHDVVYPSSMTSGDIETALVWFNKLLEQSKAPDINPLLESETAVRPDQIAWNTMLEALAKHGMVDELNNAFKRMLSNDDITLDPSHYTVVFAANMKRIPTLDVAQAEQALTFLLDKVIPPKMTRTKYMLMFNELENQCIRHGLYELAVRAMTLFKAKTFREEGPEAPDNAGHITRVHFLKFSDLLYRSSKGNVPFDLVIKLWRYAVKIGCTQGTPEQQIPAILHSYGLSRSGGVLPKVIRLKEWVMLFNAAVQLQAATMGGYRGVYVTIPDDASPGIVSLVEDMEASGFKLTQLDEELVNRILRVAFFQSGMDDLNAILSRLGPEYNRMLEELRGVDPKSPMSVYTLIPEEQLTHASSPTLTPESASDGAFPIPSSREDAAEQPVHDRDLSASIKNLIYRNSSTNLAKASAAAYALLMDGISTGRIPYFATIGLLIESLGRSCNLDLMTKAYTTAHDAIKSFSWDLRVARAGWFDIENSMIIGLAHAHKVETAHAYRKRILENGGAPSADAYGILIHTVKDTTDDTSNAMALFEEAMELKVAPNLYLYNTIISKLSKARKADYALKLFKEMTSQGIRPSSITYGAVIGACARVGDVQSAENLPRVPPYNTMMQLYTTTKPNRERALVYYNKMKRAKIAPTSYTYKLLMDAYGALEPVDIQAMENVFSALEQDTKIPVQGGHFASLIHAYGCVSKDLPKAISIFDSIASHPRAELPDADARAGREDDGVYRQLFDQGLCECWQFGASEGGL